MMNDRCFYVAVLLSLLLSGCVSDKGHTSNDDVIVLGEPDEILYMADIVEPVRFVKVEATDSCLIKHITKVIDGEDFFYLLDRSGIQPVTKFTAEGKFVREIGSKGMGPGEFSTINDVSVNKGDGNIYIVASFSEVMVYDSDGNFINRFFASDQAALCSIATGSDRILMSCDYMTHNTCQLYSFSSDFTKTGEWDYAETGFIPPLSDWLKVGDGRIFYFDWYNNLVYDYDCDTNEALLKYRLDMVDTPKEKGITDSMDFIMRQQEVSYILSWGMTDTELVFFYLLKGESCVMVWDLKENHVKYNGRYESYNPDLFSSYSLEEFIGVITIDNYDFYKQSLPSDCGLPDFDEETTNAILMYWKVKK